MALNFQGELIYRLIDPYVGVELDDKAKVTNV